jgi:hypothetical protein|tara:strand:- start:173 stop:766 length:594 start_codon:yes stop_codon:yes gene_type:complete
VSLSKIAAIGLFVLALAFSSIPVAAHGPGEFAILVRDNEMMPKAPTIFLNITAWWIDVGEDDNLTHRIVYDGDGDGNYSGELDWDSGPLHNHCEMDPETNNTTKLNEDCQTDFRVTFNGTFGEAIYQYQDLLSDGTALNGTLNVINEHKLSPGFQPPQEQPDTEEEERPAWLLAVAGISALGAAVLGYMVLQGQPKS